MREAIGNLDLVPLPFELDHLPRLLRLKLPVVLPAVLVVEYRFHAYSLPLHLLQR